MRFTLSAAGINPFLPQYSSLSKEILGKKCVNDFVYRVFGFHE